MAHYSYKPLEQDQIRLLSLVPGGPGEELRCTLRPVQLLSSTIYHDPAPDRKRRTPKSGGPWLLEGYLLAHGFGPCRDVEATSDDAHLNEENLLHDDRNSDSDEHPIAHPPLYEALSYVWGPQESPGILQIEGDNSGVLAIGPNLHDALTRLRPSPGHDARVHWVDQVCMN
jgi:hypothetical protein